MNYKNKIKQKIALNSLFAAIGAAIAALGLKTDPDSGFLLSFGTLFLIITLIRCFRYIRLINNPKALEKRRIAETDERNLAMVSWARNLAFAVYALAAAIAILIYFIVGNQTAGQITAYNLLALMLIYILSIQLAKLKF